MSSPGGDPASSLSGLFASLRADNSKGRSSSQLNTVQGTSRQSTPFNLGQTASFDFTPPAIPSQPQPRESSVPAFDVPHSRESVINATMSRQSTPAHPSAPAGSSNAQANLLNLLKFNSPAASPQPDPQQKLSASPRPEYGSPSTQSVHGRGISASDLIASFSGAKSSAPASREKESSSSTNHQDSLLKLLNRTTSRPEDQQSSSAPAVNKPIMTTHHLSHDGAGASSEERQPTKSTLSSERHESPIRYFGSSENATPTPFEPQDLLKAEPTKSSGSIFTYVNPFEQLAASSPRNAGTRSSRSADAHKRKIKSPSPAAMHTSSRRKLTPFASEILQSIESPAPEPLKDGRSQVEALMGIGAPTRDAETVADALNEVGSQVDKQVENALAKAEEKEREAEIKQEEEEDYKAATFNAIEETVHDAAVEVKHELDKDENKGILKDFMSAPVAEAVKEIIDEAAQEKGGDEWESAGAEEVDLNRRKIEVYQYPLKPFVSIDIVHSAPSNLTIRDDSVVNIARIKKDFDQADRTLATATNEFIAYGLPKNGGIRIIQQDNGQASVLFPEAQDRIFNIAISTAYPSTSNRSIQRVIATGVSGAVYWATIGEPNVELSEADMRSTGGIIPPVPTGSDSTSGGQLKTRAKKSSRHPEFFAIGRGKSIQIVFPAHARSSDFMGDGKTLDTEGYFADRSLKITTGKAGKDFTFSEDDSTIVTLDKAGKLRIWDIRDLTDESNGTASKLAPVEVRNPLMTFSTAHATEKSWPTSVLFVDKIRPYTKGIALRYIIVGMKQNHTLQLWDLCLGKAVQELSFPHGKETDAICSVTYHPGSGIIAVGHPTRNSIYLIHLSAPKYNLPGMSQAHFVQRLANKDTKLQKAEATAIMSGMREYSFAGRGDIRSLELVPSSGEAARNIEEEDPILFELYVMHSKGVTCLGIKKEDLGWSNESRVLHPVDAEKGGLIVVQELRAPSVASTSEPSGPSINGEILSTSPSKSAIKTPPKEPENPDRAVVAPSTADKADKKKNKRNGTSESIPTPTATSFVANSYANAAQRGATPAPEAKSKATKEISRPGMHKNASVDAPEDGPTRGAANGDSLNWGISGEFFDKKLTEIEQSVLSGFNKVIGKELGALYGRFAEDKRVQDAAGGAKQDAMLRLVSSTLGENVDKALSRIIQKNIQEFVIPSIGEVTSAILNKQLSSIIAQQIHNGIPPALKAALPEAISRSMQSQEVLHAISDRVTKAVSAQVEQEFARALNTSLIPSFENLTINIMKKISEDTERRARMQMEQMETQRHNDSIKIEQLKDLIRGLSETINTMAAAQTDLQIGVLKLQEKAAHDSQTIARREEGIGHSPTPSESASMQQQSPEQEELEQITIAMHGGEYEKATVMWLQSGQQIVLFDNLFVRCNPSYLRQTSPLVVLSVGAAVTASLEKNVMERLTWLETVFSAINPRDPEIREVAGRILEVLNQRLEGEYMRIAETDNQNPALRKISILARQARELRAHTL